MLCKPLFISVSKGGVEWYPDKAEWYPDEAEWYPDGSGMVSRWKLTIYPQGFATKLTEAFLWNLHQFLFWR